MKKVITITILFVMLILSASAFADPDYIGVWATIRKINDTDSEIITFRLYPGNVAYYSSQQFSADSIGPEVRKIYSWEYVSERAFNLFNENGELVGKYGMIADRRVLNDYDAYAKVLATDAMDRIDFYAMETPEPTETPQLTETPKPDLAVGVLLDPGQYIVGVDIPSGDYRFEYYDAPCDIFVYNDPNSALWNNYASVGKDHPVYAKLHLPEGARVNIGAYPVTIMYAKPLNIGE